MQTIPTVTIADALGGLPPVVHIPDSRGEIDPSCLPAIAEYSKAFDILLECNRFFYSKAPVVQIYTAREAKSLQGFEMIGPYTWGPKNRFLTYIKHLALTAADIIAIHEGVEESAEKLVQTITDLYQSQQAA